MEFDSPPPPRSSSNRRHQQVLLSIEGIMGCLSIKLQLSFLSRARYESFARSQVLRFIDC